MITEKECHELISKLLDLREKHKESNTHETSKELKKHEKICFEKLKYLITIRTNKYKSFSNWEDLNQEGYEALLFAIRTFDVKKGNFFGWAHKYIATRTYRTANFHSTIKYPLKYTKEFTPHKETTMPIMIEPNLNPHAQLEKAEINNILENSFSALSEKEREIIELYYGFNDNPMPINKICKKLSLKRPAFFAQLNSAIKKMQEKVVV